MCTDINGLFQILDLESCFWFSSHSLLALSKCKNLQELRFSYCWLEDFVPYASLGTRFGFRALRVSELFLCIFLL